MNDVFGFLATDRGYERGALFGSAGPFAGPGDNQFSIRQLYGTSTSTTAIRLTSTGENDAGLGNSLNLIAQGSRGIAYGFPPFVLVSYDKANNQACMWTISDLLVKRGAVAGSTSIVGRPIVTLSACDVNLVSAGYSVSSLSISADLMNDAINFTVPGVMRLNIDHSVLVSVVEVQ